MVETDCKLGGFNQSALNVFVPLLGKRHTQHLVGTAFLVSTESAITDSFLDRLKSSVVSDLQCPGQRGDRTHAGNSSQPLQSLRQQRVPLQRTHKGIVQLLPTLNHLPAQLQ